ncbi:MAG: hypothetical protein AAF383_04035 [Cyanobacteria bacterium P01_A01_bin.83]
MAVGDPNANRVVIYQRDGLNQWYRSRVIYPPENSSAFKAGRGFGRISELSKNILVVNSVIRRRSTSSRLVSPDNFKDFSRKNLSERKTVFQKYVFDLDLKHQMLQIDCIRNHQKELTNFYIWRDGELKLITLPNNNEEMFGVSTAVHNNLMLIGSPPSHQVNSEPKQGKGWLFDLNNLNSKPKVLTVEKAYLGKSVALSEQFAVVGNNGTDKLIGDPKISQKTLITSLNNDSSSLIDNQGYLSIDKNILAIMRPRSAMQSPWLQLFRINKYLEASLIMERKILDSYQIIKGKYIRNALLQNGWLLTIERLGKKDSLRICLESIEQMNGQ